MNAAERAKTRFEALFGTSCDLLAQAPGRVNLIGEHTDYNDGFVLPCAIEHRTAIAATARDDGRVRVVALDFDEQVDEFSAQGPFSLDPDRGWPNYIRGMYAVLQQAGHQLRGADLVIAGDVPLGAGLSSSAALEMAIGQVQRAFDSLSVSDAQMAALGQQAENEFVGCLCGIMDQMVSMRGQQGAAMLLDCRTLQIEQVPIPADLRVVILNSNKDRGLVDSEYNTRRAQCEAAASLLGVPALRDATLAQLEAVRKEMDPLVYRRARHVISENERTLAAAEALANGELARLGALMAASHASMRDDFEITVPEIDVLVEIAQAEIGSEGGARMTGGGFGGCVVALVREQGVAALCEAVAASYEPRTGHKETIYVSAASAGAAELSRNPHS